MSATRLFARAVLRLSPQDDAESVTDFLQGLVTSDVAGPLPVWAALLTPQGKVLFDFLVWPGRDLLIDCQGDSSRRPDQAAVVALQAAPKDSDHAR